MVVEGESGVSPTRALSGVYARLDGAVVNGRPVFMRRPLQWGEEETPAVYLKYLDDDSWVFTHQYTADGAVDGVL